MRSTHLALQLGLRYESGDGVYHDQVNGSGTDHGAGGAAFVIGDVVKGGLYAEYPSLAEDKLMDGDLHFNNDFRGLYATLLEDWLGLDSKPIVNGSFEKFHFIST